jgi:hypothetical protein
MHKSQPAIARIPCVRKPSIAPPFDPLAAALEDFVAIDVVSVGSVKKGVWVVTAKVVVSGSVLFLYTVLTAGMVPLLGYGGVASGVELISTARVEGRDTSWVGLDIVSTAVPIGVVLAVSSELAS